MNRCLLLSFVILIPFFSYSQPTDGATGLMKTPTAEMQIDGTFIIGANYLPDAMTSYKDFDYNTGNYFFNLTFLPFLEFTYRSTLMRWDGNRNQDRSFGFRFRGLKETKYRPAVVIGGNDLYSSSAGIGSSFFNTYYLVASKHLSVKKNQLGLTVGFGNGGVRKQNLNGFFGGITYTPSICPTIRLMAEYDAEVFSAGADLLVWNHLYIYGMAYDLNYLSGGLSYRIYFKNKHASQ